MDKHQHITLEPEHLWVPNDDHADRMGTLWVDDEGMVYILARFADSTWAAVGLDGEPWHRPLHSVEVATEGLEPVNGVIRAMTHPL